MSFFEAEEKAFSRFILGNAPLKKLADGFDWAEGPVWFGDHDYLLFSDIPNNRMLRWSPVSGLTTFRAPANFSNGNTRDREGRLVTCEHGARRVTRTEYDGAITVIADRYEGKPLNSPNDVIVASDGAIWFTDPHYGIVSDYEGTRSQQELPCNVYRVDPLSGAVHAVLTDFHCPNGLAFSPDEKRLYVADTGRIHSDDPRHIRAFDVGADWRLTGGDVFHTITPGCADGMRVDENGNLWSSAGDGVHCIAPDGRRLGKILVPETVSNVCFGGRNGHRLFITATTSLYAVSLAVRGARRRE
ncbi:SMP-30/gluconolactonase/LRE family protein [Shinella kummerowiae]|uniref:SMP-30/gluconolactonase/LRE family protein n=1 Tax=Shinella kummerowiae TaxID=417745 RepID=UPI0021B4E71E|nr:SMP-30/gluconolactonase/LRE family protein [Shinella kummerowiae]MCT7664747.1 SMP-30/gluconolactonase/LRE family protein [Shinella kummerowiae]